jgi:hypothetical protein
MRTQIRHLAARVATPAAGGGNWPGEQGIESKPPSSEQEPTMTRLFASLFAARRGSREARSAAPPRRRVRLRIEPLEGRDLMAIVPLGPTPTAVATTIGTISTLVETGIAEAPRNENLAITYFNLAASLAQRTHNPTGLLAVAAGWTFLPPGTSDFPGTVAVNFYSQAIAAAQYWISPQEGPGSGSDYAWGCGAMQQVINFAGALEGALSASNASTVAWSAETNQVALSNMTDQEVPPIAGGTWSAYFGGVYVTYTLNQYVGYASGPCTWNGQQAEITQAHIYDRSTENTGIPEGTWFGSSFTVVVQTSQGPSTITGYAQGSPQFSNEMFLYFPDANGQFTNAPVIAYRYSGNGWAP